MRTRGSLKRSQEVAAALAGAIDANVRMIRQLETSKQEAESSVAKAFERLSEALEERRKALLSDLEAVLLSKTLSLTLQKEHFQRLQQEVAHCVEVTSHCLQSHTDHEMVSLGELIPTELNATTTKVEKMSLTPNQRTFFTVSTKADSVLRELSDFAEIVDLSPAPSNSICIFKSVTMVNMQYHVELETRTSSEERYPCGGLQVKAELRPKSGGEFEEPSASVIGEVEDHEDGTYSITITPRATGRHQLHVAMDGQSVSGSPFDVEVRGDYTTLALCGGALMSVGGKSLCVTVHHPSGDVYVGSDDHRIYVFDRGGALRDTLGGWGSGDGQFKCPFGIDFKGDAMYVADCANHRVQVLTTGGKFLNKFGEKGPERGQFNNPCAIAVDSSGRVVVSDSGNNRIQVFGEDGCWLATLDGKTSGKHGIVGPRGVALDSQGNIHVAVYGLNTVKVFALDGGYIRKYGGGVVRGPTGVAVDELGYCVVCDWGGNRLVVFDPEGHVIHATAGNPSRPCRVALDPRTGSVYAANYDYNNVLKYMLRL